MRLKAKRKDLETAADFMQKKVEAVDKMHKNK